MEQHLPSVQVTGSHIDLAISLWLNEKQRHSNSELTYKTYERILNDFRRQLNVHGLDLDPDVNILGEVNEESRKKARQQLAMAAQGYAQFSSAGDPLSSATYNQRLAVLSSFYTFAKDRDYFSSANPIARLQRAKVQQYGNVQTMTPEHVAQSMKQIDRSTLYGSRDYALLGIYLQTGRRLIEVVSLSWEDVEMKEENKIQITFHCKGDKTMRDLLPAALSRAVLDWLRLAYGNLEILDPTTPLWISLKRRSKKMARLTERSVSDICKRRLGVSKVHITRHTWARRMEDAGAKVSVIQARLGHASLATTGRYLAALGQAENTHADDIAKSFGLDE